MTLLACGVLAISLGLFLPSRPILIAVIATTWAIILPAQTHSVLLVDQLDKRSYSNSIGYFAINYVILIVTLALGAWIHSRRRKVAIAAPA